MTGGLRVAGTVDAGGRVDARPLRESTSVAQRLAKFGGSVHAMLGTRRYPPGAEHCAAAPIAVGVDRLLAVAPTVEEGSAPLE